MRQRGSRREKIPQLFSSLALWVFAGAPQLVGWSVLDRGAQGLGQRVSREECNTSPGQAANKTWVAQFYVLWFPSHSFLFSAHFYRFLESMLPSHTYLQLHVNPVNPASVSTPAQKLPLAKSQRPPCCSIQEQFFRSHVTNVRPPGALISSPNFLGFCTHCKNHIHNKTSQATNTIQNQNGGWPYHPVFSFRFLFFFF